MPAADAQDARTKVYRALASSLSNIAIQLDMPISVYQSDMIELATGNRFISIMSPDPRMANGNRTDRDYVEGIPQPCRPLS